MLQRNLDVLGVPTGCTVTARRMQAAVNQILRSIMCDVTIPLDTGAGLISLLHVGRCPAVDPCGGRYGLPGAIIRALGSRSTVDVGVASCAPRGVQRIVRFVWIGVVRHDRCRLDVQKCSPYRQTQDVGGVAAESAFGWRRPMPFRAD